MPLNPAHTIYRARLAAALAALAIGASYVVSVPVAAAERKAQAPMEQAGPQVGAGKRLPGA